jgi:transposase InsO family protein
MGTQAALISGPGSSSSSTPALTPTRPPTTAPSGPSRGGGGRGGGSGGGGGRRRRGGRGGGGGGVSGGGARGNAPTLGPQQGAPRPTFHHPWSGRISMWLFHGPGSEARPPAAMFAGAQPGFTSSSGFAFASPAPWTSPAASSWPTPSAAPPSGLVGWDAAALAAFQTPTLTSPMGPEWIADTGATYHTTLDPGILTSVRPPSSLPSSIVVANGSCLPVTSVGAAGSPGSFRIPDVLVAPSLVHNLLSIRRFTTDNSCSVEFDSSGLTVKDSATRCPLLRCDSTDPLYTLQLPHATPSSSSTPTTAVVFAATTSSTTWHRRLGHPGRDALTQLTRSATIPCTRSHDEHLCHACQLGRHVRLPFSSSSHATHAFDVVHCDLWTSPIISISGYKYYLVVLDDFSHYVWTFPLRAKSETFTALRHFFAWVSTQFGLTIKAVQCDNGREFDNSTSRVFFLSHGMQLRMSCPYTSSQNGNAERMIRTTNDTIRTLLQAHLPARFWAEGLHTSTYLLNCLPSTAYPAPTPHQALFGTPPRYDHLRVFGCACYPNTTATAPQKLAPRSTLCVFLGYSPDHKGYRCFDLSSRRVLISRHVVFDEFFFPYSTTTPPSSDPDLDLFTLFPTDAVVKPPILPLSAGTRSPLVSPTPGPVPCPGPVVSPTVVSPLRGAPSPLAPGPSGGGGSAPPAGPSVPTPPARFAQPVRVYQRRPPVPTSPAAGPPPPVPPARFAQPVCVYQRRRPPPGFAPPPSPSPPLSSSPPVPSPPAAQPVAQSPPGTPIPPPRPPAARVEMPVYHPPLLHRDPRHVHPMVTRHAAGTLPPRALATTTEDSQVSPVPSSVRTTLLDPHWRRAMEEYVALVANQTWDLVPRVTQSRTPPGTRVLPVLFSTSPSLGRTSPTPCSRSVSICTTPESPT